MSEEGASAIESACMAIQRKQRTPALWLESRDILYSIHNYGSEKRRQRIVQDRGPNRHPKELTHTVPKGHRSAGQGCADIESSVVTSLSATRDSIRAGHVRPMT